MTSRILHLDFETRSTLDLKKVGLHRYADPKFTSVICLAWAFDEELVEPTYRLHDISDSVFEHVDRGGIVYAHNAVFEHQIWNRIFFPDAKIKPEQMVCTMAMAYAMGLPGSLERVAAALGVEHQKDKEGARLMMSMTKPKAVLPNGDIVWRESPEDMARLSKYCAKDVEVERAIGKRMLQLSPYEKKIWILDQKINDLGITVDRTAVTQAVKVVEEQKTILDSEMRRMTDGHVEAVTTVQQIKDYLDLYGIHRDSLAKPDVTELLTDPSLHPNARRVLELRSQGGKAATAKLQPMLDGTSNEDTRLRGCFQYSGANTRRWAGRRVQLHNLKRPSIKQSEIEFVFKALHEGLRADFIDIVFGPPMAVLADCTRGFLTASAGQELMACDFSAIEARVLAWLAGQDDVLDLFRSGADIYLKQASDIASKNITDKEDPWRLIGKVAMLALGYQGGVGAMQTMCKAYGVKMEPAFLDLWRTIDGDTQEYVKDRYEQNKAKAEISREEWMASEITKLKWRKANSSVVQYWGDTERSFSKATVSPGQPSTVGVGHQQVTFKTSGSFMRCRLPSGGVICYPYPTIQETKTPWDATKKLPSYMAEDGQSHKWQRFSTYGGSLVENITQAVARDLLADAMLRLDQAGFKIVAHVHDEIICETCPDSPGLEEMKKIMSTPPAWAMDLPLAVSGWQGFRYRK